MPPPSAICSRAFAINCNLGERLPGFSYALARRPRTRVAVGSSGKEVYSL
jgi:hypothetical protein